MALGTTRQRLVEMIRNEIRSSSNTSRSLDNLPYLHEMISRYNETITDEFGWPYMNLAKDQAMKTLAAGQRYYDFPVKLSIEHIKKVWYKQSAGSGWIPLEQGIGPKEYNGMDSDENLRSEPVVKWEFVTDDNDNLQFEVWPMPVSSGALIWFEGRKKPNAMSNDTDRADHDDRLISLRAAGEALKAKSKADSDMKIALAGDRFTRLTARLSNPRMVSLNGPAPVNRNRKRILVARSEMGA